MKPVEQLKVEEKLKETPKQEAKPEETPENPKDQEEPVAKPKAEEKPEGEAHLEDIVIVTSKCVGESPRLVLSATLQVEPEEEKPVKVEAVREMVKQNLIASSTVGDFDKFLAVLPQSKAEEKSEEEAKNEEKPEEETQVEVQASESSEIDKFVADFEHLAAMVECLFGSNKEE